MQAEGISWHGPDDDLPLRLRILVNLWIEQWRSMYNHGLMDDAEIRRLASGLFAGEAGRRHWLNHGGGYKADRRNARARAFGRIFDEELARSVRTAAVPIVSPKAGSAKRGWLVAAAAATALIAGVSIGRRRFG
ncbi:DUF6082 family protein [Nonomuraea insulae]|uniref:DUF6082 family protein n=1 Tax=Nonomuraea insulae TaxID=1616787 RepID=A0ABW1DBS4_9ACTN